MIWWYDKAIKHQKLNNVENPCNDSPGYKYQSCIVGKMLEKLKCQPFWLNISQTLKTCTEVEKMQKFLKSVFWLLKVIFWLLRAVFWLIWAVFWLLRDIFWLFRAVFWLLRAVILLRTVVLLRAVFWLLRAVFRLFRAVVLLRAVVWFLRAVFWFLRAVVLLRAVFRFLRLRCSGCIYNIFKAFTCSMILKKNMINEFVEMYSVHNYKIWKQWAKYATEAWNFFTKICHRQT